MQSAVNMLPNSPKISDLTKRNVSQLNFSKINGKWDKSAAVEVLAVFGTRRDLEGCCKTGLSGFEETTFLGVNNL